MLAFTSKKCVVSTFTGPHILRLIWDTCIRIGTALSNQTSRTFQRQFLIFQGLKITEVQGLAIFR